MIVPAAATRTPAKAITPLVSPVDAASAEPESLPVVVAVVEPPVVVVVVEPPDDLLLVVEELLEELEELDELLEELEEDDDSVSLASVGLMSFLAASSS